MPYKQALALKELGFDEPCLKWFMWRDKGDYQCVSDLYDFPIDENGGISAPLYQQAFRWFREKYELEGVTQRAEDFMWYKWIIHRYNENGKKYVADWYEYKTYEEAELECLKKLIEFVKESI